MDEEKHGAKINADKARRVLCEWKSFCIYLPMMPSVVREYSDCKCGNFSIGYYRDGTLSRNDRTRLSLKPHEILLSIEAMVMKRKPWKQKRLSSWCKSFSKYGT